MTGIQRVRQIIIALLTIVSAIFMAYQPENGLIIVVLLMSVTCILDGIKTIIYYFSMARYMVGGQLVLYRGMIELDAGLLAMTLGNAPIEMVFIYLLGFYFISGVINVMRSLESRKMGSRWRMKMANGILDIVVSALCVLFAGRTNVILYIYCSGLIYSSILRMINALKKTSVVYIQ